ncbi:MAG TPA: hypothetical protein DCP57_09130 [Gammaproteobacteria bacterium]|nr:hypothetical protein [Gammaproteobacteria bacterium]
MASSIPGSQSIIVFFTFYSSLMALNTPSLPYASLTPGPQGCSGSKTIFEPQPETASGVFSRVAPQH